MLVSPTCAQNWCKETCRLFVNHPLSVFSSRFTSLSWQPNIPESLFGTFLSQWIDVKTQNSHFRSHFWLFQSDQEQRNKNTEHELTCLFNTTTWRVSSIRDFPPDEIDGDTHMHTHTVSWHLEGGEEWSGLLEAMCVPRPAVQSMWEDGKGRAEGQYNTL